MLAEKMSSIWVSGQRGNTNLAVAASKTTTASGWQMVAGSKRGTVSVEEAARKVRCVNFCSCLTLEKLR